MTTTDDTFADLLSWPRTDLTVAADEFVSRVSSEYLYNDCVRSYLFARAVARAQGLTPGSDYDDELVYLSCILHDLGATDTANGNQRSRSTGPTPPRRFCGIAASTSRGLESSGMRSPCTPVSGWRIASGRWRRCRRSALAPT